MKNQIADFIDDLRSSHGKGLVSVILYGPAAGRDIARQRSEYTTLVTLEKIGPGELLRAHAAVREWTRLGYPVPVYFTVSELKDAADVFPIEFSGMKAVRKVLHGADVLADLEFSSTNLRHQVEYELRSKLIGLRRAYIPASSTAQGLVTLMTESLPNLTVIFGAVLMLQDVNPPGTKREVLALTAERLAIDGTSFEKVLNIRENNFTETLDEVKANKLFAEYIGQIEKVIDAVNAIEH